MFSAAVVCTRELSTADDGRKISRTIIAGVRVATQDDAMALSFVDSHLRQSCSGGLNSFRGRRSYRARGGARRGDGKHSHRSACSASGSQWKPSGEVTASITSDGGKLRLRGELGRRQACLEVAEALKVRGTLGRDQHPKSCLRADRAGHRRDDAGCLGGDQDVLWGVQAFLAHRDENAPGNIGLLPPVPIAGTDTAPTRHQGRDAGLTKVLPGAGPRGSVTRNRAVGAGTGDEAREAEIRAARQEIPYAETARLKT